MLNELLIIERGARQAGIEMAQRDPDVKDVGKKPTLRVRLDMNGRVVDVDPAPANLRLWTFGKGNKQRFPFLQPNAPLMYLNDIDTLRLLKGEKRRNRVIDLCQHASFNESDLIDWPGVRDKKGNWSQNPNDYLSSLRKRHKQILGLENTDGESVLAVVDRFLTACNAPNGGVNLLRQIAIKLVAALKHTAVDDWLRVGEPLLFFGGGALFFDVPSHEFSRLASDPRQIMAVSQALKKADKSADGKSDGNRGKCSLTGKEEQLVEETFPELVVPVIGKTILFSRFSAIPSNARYGRFGAKSYAVGQTVAEDLASVLRALTSPERKFLTWQSIPGEAPKQSDLFLAFVDEALDAPAASLLAGNEEDLSDEEPNSVADSASSVAAFEKRTERLIEAVQAKVKVDLRKTPVRLMIISKVDPANRKVAFASAPTVAEVYKAATTWVAGERNVPTWLTLPILQKGEQKPRPMVPPHVAPLGLIAFSKKVYIRAGKESQEVVGLTAAETLKCFLDPSGNGDLSARHRAKRILRMTLRRRASLVSGSAHALRLGFDFAKDYDRHETLRTITIFGVLLHKLDRDKEVYMNETAFKLGQLLAAADVVHAGYCADVRGGAVPPSLLGNQIFAMAQAAPNKALAVFCRRWKPYDGWAKKASRDSNRAEELLASKQKSDQQRGWDIKKALRQSRQMGALAAELAPALEGCRVNDIFLAELLLGYIAGFPKVQKEEGGAQDSNHNDTNNKEG